MIHVGNLNELHLVHTLSGVAMIKTLRRNLRTKNLTTCLQISLVEMDEERDLHACKFVGGISDADTSFMNMQPRKSVATVK